MDKSKGLSEVMAKWVVKIPEGRVEIKVEEGDEVNLGDELAKLAEDDFELVDLMGVLSRVKETEREKMILSLKGRMVKRGEMLVKLPGWWSNTTVVSPVEGEVGEINEFGQAVIKLAGGEKKKSIKAPVRSRVVQVEKERVVLGFEAIEVAGEGLGGSKVWGNGVVKLLEEISQIKSDLESRIGFTQKLDEMWLAKAEVLRVGGLIWCSSAEYRGNADLPVVKIAPKVWEELRQRLGGQEKRLMVNPKLGRVLVVVQ